MTGERDTVNQLRSRLGLGNSKLSGRDLVEVERSSRLNLTKGPESKRGFQSLSPNNQTGPGMVSFKGQSSALRQTSQENKWAHPPKRERFQPHSTDFQQLQFHPTRQSRQVMQQSSRSPLRGSQSRSKSKEKQSLEYSRIYQPSGQSIERSFQIGRSSRSPLRSSPKHNDMSMEDDYVIRPVLVPGTGTSHQSNVSFNPERSEQNNSTNLVGEPARDKLYRDRIEAMTLDNQSLQRRLNQVTQELERINREIEDMNRQAVFIEGDVSNLDRMVDHKDDIDASNNIMKEDLERIKMANLSLHDKVKQEEVETINVNTKLDHTTQNRNLLEHESGNMNADFANRIRRFEDISQQRSDNQHRLHEVNNELERLNREHLQTNHENIDMETHVARLQAERRDLLANVERITIMFDNCVNDMTRDRRSQDDQNDWHTKQIVAKLVFQTLEMSCKLRKQHVFNELTQYCDFDRTCHGKLRSFANVLEKLGRFKMTTGLNQWYDLALKPLKTRQQNDDISMVVDCNRLQATVFYAWRQYQRDRTDAYHFKTNAIEKIWNHLNKDATKDMKRAFDMWKGKQSHQTTSKKKFKQLMRKRELRQLEQALYNWKGWSMNLENAVRMKVLQIDFTSKAFKTQVFNQMRLTLRNQKRVRQRLLNKYTKAWKDFISYNRQLMQMNMAAITFGENNRQFTQKNVFMALRQHAEQKKYALMTHALKEDMDVGIAQAKEFNGKKSTALARSNQLRASNIVRDMLGKRLWSYFEHWRDANANYHQTMDMKVKGKIIRMYKNYLQSYFTAWKKKLNDKERQKKMKMVQTMQFEAEQATIEALEGEKDNRAKAEMVRSSQRRMVDKTFKKLFFRRVAVALGRWKDICVTKGTQEDRARFVLNKMRGRFLRQAFDRYLVFHRKSQQHGRNENSADFLVQTIHLREMRKVYFAMCYYTQWRKRVKQVWHKVLYRFDFFQKQRSMKRWCDNAHEKYQKELTRRQDALTGQIKEANEEIGAMTKFQFGQDQETGDLNKFQRKKAYRQIALFFNRAYMKHLTEKFGSWKTSTKEHLHRQKIMRRSIEHFNKNYLASCQRVFLKFLSDDRRRQRIEEIKATEIQNTDLKLAIDYANKAQEEFRASQNLFVGETGCVSAEMERKVLHTMETMERRQHTLVHVSKLRMIFEMWNHVCKQEKASAYAIKNALEKTLYKEGFDSIKASYRDMTYTDQVQYTLRKWSMKAQKNHQTQAFNKWKNFGLNKVDNSKNETEKQFLADSEKFEAFVDQAKDANNARCFKFFQERNQKNILRGWKHVIEHFKLVKAKTAEFKQRQLDIRRSYVLKRWSMRHQATLKAKARNDQLVNSFKFKYYKGAFNGWKRQWQNDKRFLVSLSNLENLMRTKIVGDSFKDVKAFSISKDLVTNNKKGKGKQELVQLIQNAYLKQLRMEFQKFQENNGGNDQKNNQLRHIFMKTHSQRCRNAFDWWKRKHELAELQHDLHNAGPVRAEHWKAEREIKNLQEFMREERYTEDQIDKFYDDVCSTNDMLLKKYVTRFRIRNDQDKNILPQIMNRWKEYTAMRKLIKYQINFCTNNTQDERADIQRAFNKMKKGPMHLTDELWRLPTKTLAELGVKTSQELDDCQDQIAENSSINNHLVLQRDEFLNYYIKGQILAMALIKDRNMFSEYQATSRWLWARRQMTKLDFERDIRDGAYLHANLQEKEKQLVKENSQLEKENGELSQFTKDGTIIKNNMLKLVEERDKLVERIADTDDDYNELLEQNASLMKDVEEAENAVAAFKENKKPSKFQDVPQLKKKPTEVEMPPDEPEIADETEEQKAQRLRFERLQKISQGAGLR